MERRTNLKKRTDGVSPVVGVMLMLVVTIIIAAVVATFASGLVTEQEKAPTIVVDTTIRSNENVAGMFYMKVMSVSEAISTANLKLVTSWSTTEKSTTETFDGTTYNLGDTIMVTTTVLPYSGTNNNTMYTTKMGTGTNYTFHSPIGWGPGVTGELLSGTMAYTENQYWGNFALTSGTVLRHTASAADGAYLYGDIKGSGTDSMDAILGKGWWNLRAGDVVTVKIVDIDTGSLLVNQKVIVTRG